MGCRSMLVPNGLFVTRDEKGYYIVLHAPSSKKVSTPFVTEKAAISFAQSLDEVGVDWYGTTNHLEKNTQVAECVERGTT